MGGRVSQGWGLIRVPCELFEAQLDLLEVVGSWIGAGYLVLSKVGRGRTESEGRPEVRIVPTIGTLL